jgi:hypothetical protein
MGQTVLVVPGAFRAKTRLAPRTEDDTRPYPALDIATEERSNKPLQCRGPRVIALPIALFRPLAVYLSKIGDKTRLRE